MDVNDPNELNDSLQRLRDRTIIKPPKSNNTVLFTHQGKFDKAYGFYPPAGTTIIFKPDGSRQPQPIAVLSFEEFLNLK
ncbi:hypothetical protein [Macrococcus armenti]|uniref:hypothetical protein n=1 Tax=Macrococcus armenti TaxID=2875764 RepID=UPI001CC9BE7C|nr:hypothetical protein [Macrococcus armenti]UBH13377.1 hypothetical protein LAU43_01360 [Macrococcus armenti]